MPIVLAALTVIIQGCFIFHVFKTGRPYWWAFIILSFPVIGCVVYYFVEVFPGSREARKAGKIAQKLGKRIGGDTEFARRVEEVEICGSVDNKLALARECAERGLHADAARLFHSCVQGPYADDPNLLLGLAGAQVETQDYASARDTLATLQAKAPAFKPNDADLLRARVSEGLGDTQAALREYAALLPVYVGLEARYRHVSLLKRTGQTGDALQAFASLQEHARKHRVSHDGELAWLNLAKQEFRQ